ncbi:MAG: sulfite exporter TauE/SafE family protein [Actinomycetota bacterium]
MTPLEILLLSAGGIAAGFINTVAGGGSVIAIPILAGIVGPTVANGTLRISILMQGIAGVAGFHSGKAMPWRAVVPLIVPSTLGAVGGAWVATEVSAGFMRAAFAVAVLLVALTVFVKPSRWVNPSAPRLHEPWRSLAFAAIGFYGGFLQVGIGFFLLLALVPGLGMGLVKGNAAKTLLVLIYAPLVLLLFARAAQVDWYAGLVLGVGSVVGALIASLLAVREGATRWLRWAVVLSAVGAAVHMLITA